jgi:hypothetical protein
MNEARWVVALAALCGVVVVGQATTGCGSDEASFPSSSSGSGGAGASSSGVGGQAGDCPAVPGYDPVAAGLPSCCDAGNAHCVPVGEVPVALAPNFDPCDAQGGGQGLCLPDAVILAGTDYEAPPCTSFGDAEGVCFSKCIPAVANDPATALLPQDVCADDELCVPCVNPLDGTSTGACELEICPSGAGGAGGTGGGGEGGAAPECPHEGPPVVDPDIFDPCTPACPGAHCLPAALIPVDQQALLAPCTSGGNAGFCAPDVLIETGGNFIPPTCESVGGAEGRCISACLPDVAAQAAFLPQSTCDASERCVPCYDPFTQLSTGVCNLSCDPGPVEPPLELTCPWEGPPLIDPSTLPECDPACGGAHCLPEALVGPAEQALLAPCPGGFCAPDLLIETAGQTPPPSCVSVAGAEGRCLSTCLPDIAAQAAFLPQSSCAAEERCVPCYDPTAADPTLPTGACSLACDAPVDPPTIITCPWNGPPLLDPATFPECDPVCGGAHCVPDTLVPPDQQALLAACPGGFCLPDPLISTAGNYLPQSCTAFPGTTSEGRCLSDCLPVVAAQIDNLSQDVCPSGEHCVPCYDPFTGLETGACSSTSCDAPVDPPYTFPTCCPFEGTDQGTCLPSALIPPDDQANLLQHSCPTDMLCIPNEYLPDPPIPIQTCTGGWGTGACVSQCVDGVPTFFGQGDCPGNHICVPCWIAPTTPGCS